MGGGQTEPKGRERKVITPTKRWLFKYWKNQQSIAATGKESPLMEDEVVKNGSER